ncbi:hypothetical protein [Frondihabitans cladoniiphilus]|uniref:Uncharacterized protein n=1 Tax=Frondihabitans cladoniiphilus TaxID=715785 RepID=A0ABP8WBT5_9MICO
MGSITTRVAAVAAGLLTLGLIALIVVFAATTPETANGCPGVARIATVQVELSGATARVALVRICTDAGCSPSPSATPTLSPTPDAPSASPTPTSASGSIPVLTDATGAIWSYDLGGYAREIDVTALDAAGQTVAAQAFTPSWTRAAPADSCDITRATPPLALAVPAG